MSRSYKHTPITKDHDHKNFAKIAANRRFRRKYSQGNLLDENIDLFNNKLYRKAFEQYEIHDQIYFQSEELARKEYEYYCKPCAYWYSSRWRLRSRDYCEKKAEEFRKEYPTFEDYVAKSWGKYYRRK